MPTIASAKKALRVSKRRKKVNDRAVDSFKDVKRDIKKALVKGDLKTVKKLEGEMHSKLDMAVKKKVIHKNKSARMKAVLSKELKKASEKK